MYIKTYQLYQLLQAITKFDLLSEPGAFASLFKVINPQI